MVRCDRCTARYTRPSASHGRSLRETVTRAMAVVAPAMIPPTMIFGSMLRIATVFAATLVMIRICIAAEAIVGDGDTLTVDGIKYRLDGIDAPEADQICLDASGAVWSCGIEAREQLK